MHQEKVTHTVKVEADSCCCTGVGSWCKFTFFKSDKTTVTQESVSVAENQNKVEK